MGSFFSVQYMVDSFPILASYLPVTLFITLVSGVLGIFLGMGLAVIRVKEIPGLNLLTRVFISFIRSTPFLVQLFVVYFGIPELLQKMGLDVNELPPMLFILVIFVLHVGAYGAEILRSSILAVAPGEKEAAASLGMTSVQVYRRVILPQAAVFALPLFANQFLSTMKSTSIVFVITVIELFGAAKLFCEDNSQYFEAYMAVACLYWAMGIIFEFLFDRLEYRLSRFRRGNAA